MKKALIAASVISLVAESASAALLADPADAAASRAPTVTAKATRTGVEAASVEYMKRTVFSPDGKVMNAQEEWQDTKASRSKSMFLTPAKDDPNKMVTAVTIVNGKQSVSFTMDSNGHILGGDRHAYPQAMKPTSIFAAEKERYTRKEWKNKGKVTENGVSYTKVTRTYTSVGTKFTENVLLNHSGLPVKETIYTIKGGKSKLLFKVGYEYDKLKADNGLFNLDGVKLPND